jgi:hypothetical protein
VCARANLSSPVKGKPFAGIVNCRKRSWLNELDYALPSGPDALVKGYVLTLPLDPQRVGNLLPSRRNIVHYKSERFNDALSGDGYFITNTHSPTRKSRNKILTEVDLAAAFAKTR